MTGDQILADLNIEKISMLQDAEKTLGTADILMAYLPGKPDTLQSANIMRGGWAFAKLNDSQVECLAGLEKKLDAVVLAYQKTG